MYVVVSSDQDRVEEAKAELNKLTNEDESCARFCQHAHAIHGKSLEKIMTDVRQTGALWW